MLVWSDVPQVTLPDDMTQFEELFAKRNVTTTGSHDSIAESMAGRASKVVTPPIYKPHLLYIVVAR